MVPRGSDLLSRSHPVVAITRDRLRLERLIVTDFRRVGSFWVQAKDPSHDCNPSQHFCGFLPRSEVEISRY